MKVKNRGWMFFIVYLAATAVSLSQLKVVPVMADVAEDMGITLSDASWLTSVFTVAGIVLAIPGAAILQRIGAKRLMMLLMLSLVIGNLIGAFAANYALLLFSRAIEGIAFAMVIMDGVVLIEMWYPGNSTAVGVFMTFESLANVVIMNSAGVIADRIGMSGLWLVMVALAAICFLLVGVFIREVRSDDAPESADNPQISFLQAFRSRQLQFLAGGQLCVAFVIFTLITIYPTLFMEECALGETQANFYAGLFGLFTCPFCVIAGIIIDRYGKEALLAALCFIGSAAACFAILFFSPGHPATYVLHTLVMACVTGMGMTAIISTAPGVMHNPAYTGIAVAIVNMAYYFGIFIGSPITMGLAAKLGWGSSGILLGLVSLLGAAILFLYMRGERELTAREP